MNASGEKISWTNCKEFQVSESIFNSFKWVKKMFGCSLCGHTFEIGDVARWIYANGTPNQRTGNFFVCAACDGPDGIVMNRGKEVLEQTMKMAKVWGFLGKDEQ